MQTRAQILSGYLACSTRLSTPKSMIDDVMGIFGKVDVSDQSIVTICADFFDYIDDTAYRHFVEEIKQAGDVCISETGVKTFCF